jgi:hypothetical protein
MSSAFDKLIGAGKPLKSEPADAAEFAGLIRSGCLRLRDAKNKKLSLESRFDLAYNAAHSLCLAVLRRRGYRSTQRYVVFQLLPQTLGLGPDVWRVLSKCHDIRNLGEYEGSLDIDERIVDALIAACQAVSDEVDDLPAP